MRILSGKVLSTKMAKTAVVTVSHYKTHPKYQKKYLVSKKYYAHDPENKAKVGTTVFILEQRPLSKLKRWLIIDKEQAKKLIQTSHAKKLETAKQAKATADNIIEFTFPHTKRKKRPKKKAEEAATPAIETAEVKSENIQAPITDTKPEEAKPAT